MCVILLQEALKPKVGVYSLCYLVAGCFETRGRGVQCVILLQEALKPKVGVYSLCYLVAGGFSWKLASNCFLTNGHDAYSR